jgi:signal transduction histidine kinase
MEIRRQLAAYTYLILPLFLGLGCFSAKAQKHPVSARHIVPMQLDSQQAWLRRLGPADTLRVAALTNMGNLYTNTSLDSARACLQQAVRLARRLRYARGLPYPLNSLSAVDYYVSDYPAAERNFEATLAAARRVGNHELIGHAYLGLGNVAWELGNKEASHRYYEQARQAYAATRPPLVLGELLVLHNSANNYLNQELPAQARPLLVQARTLLAKLSPAAKADVRTVALANKLLVLWGRVQRLHQPDSAAATWRLAVARSRAAHLPESEASAMLRLALLAKDQYRWPAALAYAQQASRLWRTLGYTEQVAEALHIQADALAALHHPEAFDTLNRYTALRDTLLNQQRLEAVATAQARFDRAGQEVRIAGLEKDRRILALEAERRRTRTRLLAVAGTGGALLLLAAVLLAYRRRQRRQEAALRQRLAADLHDDLGPLLTQLAVETSLLRENATSPEQLFARLQRLTDTSQRATHHLAEMLRELDQGPAAAAPAPLGELVNQLREQAHEALSPHELGLTFQLADPALAERLLPAPTRHALALIFREALHNVVKHAAGATLVQARLSAANGGLQLVLHDDGQAPATEARPGGRGLRNMQTRAQALGGQLSAQPGPTGFEVRAWLPG